ncbi:MAG: hypothetical protein KatS3mg091_292 [Patescibacteria group bacterium]|nr:MAG: hypothetical protein KatS3mg090_0643 [Patescibacteria group bacterium]GIW63490.1 MAG: hypothetical protein KatS3mg091_292 [Patescibacteria group bacterium]
MKKTSNISNILGLFKSYLINQNKLADNPIAKSSIRNYISDTKHFLYWALKQAIEHNSTTAQDSISIFKWLNKDLLESYKTDLFAKKVPVSTIDRRISSIRRFFQFCIFKNYINDKNIGQITNLSTDLQIKKQQLMFSRFLKEKHNLSEDTIRTILDDINEMLAVSTSN